MVADHARPRGAPRLGVDVGGTFTDVALQDETGALVVHKLRSRPADPGGAVLAGLDDLLERPGELAFFGHGTTVATNAIVQRRGAKVALLTTRGFGDVLDLARQARPNLYDYRVQRPAPLVPRPAVFEVTERIAADGRILTPLDETELVAITAALAAGGFAAVAVGFLHAAVNPVHEQRAVARLEAALPGVFLTASAAICPEPREYERLSTAVANAYLGPAIGGYLRRLEAGARERGVRVPVHHVTSNGGLASTAAVTPVPVRLCLSGPAAGVAAAARLACSHGLDLVATFDVGGTSTDVAVLRGGEVPFTPAREIDGLPLRTPMVDMDVIGAGGGSLARVDQAGGLTVGPDSAGADPGPVAFGRGGTMPTLTDALLVLGRLDPAGLLGGRIPVDVEAAAAALDGAIARPLGLDVQRAALGVVRVAVAAMVRCLRAQAVRRGLDLRGAWLVAYGGAGPTLAAEVLREARMAGFLVPPEPGIFCAAALLGGEVAADHSATLLAAVDDDAWPRVVAAHQRLRDAADAWLAGEGVPAAARSFPLTLELRFRGQGHDLAVGFADGRLPPPAEVLAALAAAHARALGTTVEGRAAELTVLRVRAVGRLATAAPHPRPTPLQLHPHRRVGLPGGRETVAVLDRAALVPGTQRPGACIVQELTSTTLVLPGQRLRVAADGALMVQEMRDG